MNLSEASIHGVNLGLDVAAMFLLAISLVIASGIVSVLIFDYFVRYWMKKKGEDVNE